MFTLENDFLYNLNLKKNIFGNSEDTLFLHEWDFMVLHIVIFFERVINYDI